MGRFGITSDKPSLLMTWKPDSSGVQYERSHKCTSL